MHRPSVVSWFKAYAGLMLLVYLVVTAAGAFFLIAPESIVDPAADLSSNRPSDLNEAKIMGAIYAGLGVVLGLAFAISLFTPRRPWSWIYNLVMIALGMTSCVCLPATVPLLIFWIKPEVRAWYRGMG